MSTKKTKNNSWFVRQIKSRGVVLFIISIFYACLCIFSLAVGIYMMVTKYDIIKDALPENVYEYLKNHLSISLNIFFGLLTFFVGILQGITSYGVFGNKPRWLYWFSFGFSVFSLLSCTPKLFMRITAFSIIKIVCYIAIIVLLIVFRKRTNAEFVKKTKTNTKTQK